MSKLTIIQLLNKIAKGEEVPKKIKYDGMIFDYQEDTYEYLCYEENNFSLLGYDNPYDMLNDNVEIIEEEKEIDKLDFTFDNTIWETEYQTANDIEQKLINQNAILKQKVDNLIDVINDMRDKEC